MSRKQANNSAKRPSKIWGLFALIILMVCLLVQLPISWIAQRVMPNNPYIQWVSGNIWHGSATWQLPPTAENKMLAGNANWQWKPLKILTGKFSADVEISTGKTKLNGEMNIGLQSAQLQKVSGRIYQETLANIVNWQLPDAPIQVNNIGIKIDKTTGFDKATGQMTWAGGQLGYPYNGVVQQVNLPALKVDLNTETKAENKMLHAHIVNQEDKTLGDLYLDKEGMLDISLTQRLLENVPSYQGSAPKDSPVVSLRQPISSL
ncbi:MAG: type II secretion system protein N [Moraxellaceae bacterium]|nr:type II secretion system protein N [Moraxellaceae bacterium]